MCVGGSRCVGGLPGDRKHVPKVRFSAQPSMCVNVSLRSSSTHGGVGCFLKCIGSAGFLRHENRLKNQRFSLVCQRLGDRLHAPEVRFSGRFGGILATDSAAPKAGFGSATVRCGFAPRGVVPGDGIHVPKDSCCATLRKELRNH
jgi:hypothetical protein